MLPSCPGWYRSLQGLWGQVSWCSAGRRDVTALQPRGCASICTHSRAAASSGVAVALIMQTCASARLSPPLPWIRFKIRFSCSQSPRVSAAQRNLLSWSQDGCLPGYRGWARSPGLGTGLAGSWNRSQLLPSPRGCGAAASAGTPAALPAPPPALGSDSIKMLVLIWQRQLWDINRQYFAAEKENDNTLHQDYYSAVP